MNAGSKRQPKQANNNQPRAARKRARRGKQQQQQPATTTTTAPVSIAVRTVNRGPVYNGKRKQNVVLAHREMVGRVSNSDVFLNQQYSINPGLPVLFPWLSRIASRYESYVFKRLKFAYSPSCSSSTAGTLALAVDYDASDDPPYNLQQMTQYESAVQGNVWAKLENACAQSDLHKQKTFFVRSDALAANQDIKLYDVGTLNVATELGAVAPSGYLWVDYEVELMTPNLQNTPGGSALSSSWKGNSVASLQAAIKSGNAPLTVGGTATTITLTATQPFSALIALQLLGTGIAPAATTVSGGATVVGNDQQENSAITDCIFQTVANFPAGGVVTFNFASTTITGATLRAAQYLYTNA